QLPSSLHRRSDILKLSGRRHFHSASHTACSQSNLTSSLPPCLPPLSLSLSHTHTHTLTHTTPPPLSRSLSLFLSPPPRSVGGAGRSLQNPTWSNERWGSCGATLSNIRAHSENHGISSRVYPPARHVWTGKRDGSENQRGFTLFGGYTSLNVCRKKKENKKASERA
ncbi:hypothetical protein COCON_G00039190, partial [Conger conger]